MLFAVIKIEERERKRFITVERESLVSVESSIRDVERKNLNVMKMGMKNECQNQHCITLTLLQ